MHLGAFAVSVASLLLFAVAGCGSSHEASMGSSVRDLDTRAQTVQQLETMHDAAVRNAPSVSDAQQAESHHCADLGDRLDSMRRMCDAMMPCAGAEAPNVQATMDLTDEARHECAAHAAAMANANDMSTMMDEENRHHAAMADWMSRWNGLRGSMMGGGSTMGGGSMMGGGNGPACGNGGMM